MEAMGNDDALRGLCLASYHVYAPVERKWLLRGLGHGHLITMSCAAAVSYHCHSHSAPLISGSARDPEVMLP